MGGSTIAYTSYDWTVYSSTRGRPLKDAWIFAFNVSEKLVDPKEVRGKKAVIQQEMKMSECNANTELWQIHPAATRQIPCVIM